MNGVPIFPSNGAQQSLPDNFIFEQVDPSQDDDDSDSDNYAHVNPNLHGAQQTGPSGLKPGKKTKGRVKIKMEFIENKLRRYTTFSKRKTGIMKKAYELSTLTGTQVMLLVASETGHVYTFATRKLQPIITSESGKALIQTCLYSPDPPPGTPSGNGLEQRMNPSGFEETDLSCALGEEEQPPVKTAEQTVRIVLPDSTPVSFSSQQDQTQSSRNLGANQARVIKAAVHSPSQNHEKQEAIIENQTAAQKKLITLTNDMLQNLKTSVAESNHSNIKNNNSNSANTTATSNVFTNLAPGVMQVPMIIPQGIQLHPSSQSLGQPVAVSQVNQSANSQTVVKGTMVKDLNHVISALHSQHAANSSQNNQSGDLNTPLPASTPSAINIMQGMTPGIVMYHTPQGIVYATPTQNFQDRTIFNFQQPATAISMTQADQSSGQQIITIPVPVSLSGTPLLLAPPPSVESSSGDSSKVSQPPAKKSKK